MDYNYKTEQDATTGPFGNPTDNTFDFNTKADPIRSWTLCPGDFANRLIVSGIEIVKFDYTTYTAGTCETLDGFPEVTFHLGLGDYITEAFGRTGVRLDKLTFIVTPSEKNQHPSVHYAGGFFGGPFDATPDPKVFGPCALVNMDGTWGDNIGGPGNDLTSLGFYWSCLGVPDNFY